MSKLHYYTIKILFGLYFILSLSLWTSCEKIEALPLNTDELNSRKAVENVLQEGYELWWTANHSPEVVLALSVAGDAYGLSIGNFGTLEMGNEPRKAFDNTVGNAVAEVAWFNNLKAVSKANQVMMNVEKAFINQMHLASAHFLRGISWGYLGLIFDKAILSEAQNSTDIDQVLVDYQKVIDKAIKELEKAIQLAEESTGFQHTYFNGVVLDKPKFIALAHAYAARFLTQMARTADEKKATNWESVYYHADRGINFDFAPEADGKTWQSYQQYTFAETGSGPFWARVDQRLVAAMDASQPVRYPEPSNPSQSALPSKRANSMDARLQSDFIFQERIFFKPELGFWHFSHYQHHRNMTDATFSGDGKNGGIMPVFLASDVLLLKAEAALELGGAIEAIGLLNQSARTTRGKWSPLQGRTTPEKIEEVIRYERAIELLGSAPMSLWLDRRRWAKRINIGELDALGGLQVGTPAHLPVPAKELQVHKLEIYTFGGENDLLGIQAIIQ
jgi:tetratricopeptide (TPR) repeat protein